MSQVNSYSFLFLFLLVSLSCSQKSKKERPEEHPHSMDSSVELKQEAEITLCDGTVNRQHFHLIKIYQMKFNPDILNVQRGDTVVWVNCDIVDHDITEEKKKRWQSPSLATTKSWQKIVTESADYYCSIHLVMKGKLVVAKEGI